MTTQSQEAAVSAPASRAPARPKRSSWRRKLIGHRGGLWGLVILSVFALVAILAPLIAPYDPINANISNALQPPSALHLFGTDELGRDVLSRIIYGAGISMTVGILSVVVGMGIGVPFGLVSGFYGGWIDLIAQRVADTLQAFPGILMALLVASLFGQNLVWIVSALGLVSVPIYVRLVRARVLEVKVQPYIEAARSLGATNRRLMWRHILPNVISPVIVQSTLQFGFSVLLLAGLGFLGIGARPPIAEWGAMLAAGKGFLRNAPHLVLFPSIAITLVVLALNLIGDALRDAIDPQSSRAP